jgi:hypothetical protein
MWKKRSLATCANGDAWPQARGKPASDIGARAATATATTREIEVIRAAHDHDGPYALAMTDRQVADLLRAKVMAHEYGLAFAERIHDAQHVVHHEVRVVQRRVDGAIAATVPRWSIATAR